MCAAVCAMLIVCAPAPAQDTVKDQAHCYTTWDDSYLYLAFQIDCPDVRSTHSAPNAPVNGDDAVEFYIDTAKNRSEKIVPTCFSMSVSASGGSQFRAGTNSGELKPVNVFTFRYGATVQGTINNSDDIDLGYTVEIAVPWQLLNAKSPGMGDMMAFNVIIRSHGESGGSFISLSPQVQTEADTIDPTKWSSIVFAPNTFGVATTGYEKILSPRYIVRAPLVDGVLGDKEYHRNTSFTLDMPLPAGFVYEAKYPVQRLVLSRYFYWYQADQRKVAPYAHISNPDGSYRLQDFPINNAGPWFSYDRVQWHKDELSAMAAAGIDVALPVYRGDKASRAAFAAKGLDCMVSALRELRAEGKPYPLIGVFFDTAAMELAYGSKPDLRTDEVKRAFYGMIRDFYDRVPREFRAIAQAGKPDAGQQANIVALGTCSHFSDFDSSFVDYCNTQFRNDFGCPLVWIASTDYKDKANVFDAFANHAGLALDYEPPEGRVRACTVSAGFDDSAVAGDAARIASRMGGETYERNWAEALLSDPQWVICDGWNGFHEGSDLCESRQYNGKYTDATRASVNRFRGGRDFDVQYLRYNIPSVIPAKRFATAQLVLRNIGNSPWRVSDGYALGYRWYRSGRYFGESRVRRPLDRDVFPGDTISLDVGIATVNMQGDALPDGDCELRIELMRTSDGKWFSALGDQPLMVPVKIGSAPEWAAGYLACDAPVLMATGESYPVSIRVRNDGSTTWPKGVAKLGCTLYKVSNYTHGSPSATAEQVPIRDVRALLVKDCKPGEVAEFSIDLILVTSNGKPLPVWKQEYPWSYQIRFDLYNGEKWLSELGVPTLNRVVDLFEDDYGPRIVDCDVPRALNAGQTVETKVVIRNAGTRVWDRKRAKIGYHWYHLDGTELLWDGATTPLPTNIEPGWPAMVNARVTAPEYDGRYVLVWDLMMDDKWLSTEPLSRGGDILPITVEVKGGRLAFVDLKDYCDVSAASPDTDRTLGDFDGKGESFPVELMLPDVGQTDELRPIYPVGYNWDRRTRGNGRISFLYPDKGSGAKNAVACAGQKIDFEDGAYTAVHIVGASTDGPASGDVSLNYNSGAQSAKLALGDWAGAPAEVNAVAYAIRHRHSNGGDEIGKTCSLYSCSIPVDSSKVLTSITLPLAKNMKVIAITLERASASEDTARK